MVTISVVIPAYNAGRWIDETLDSVLGQTRPPDEIVIIDDGSTDDTADRARSRGDLVRVVQQSNAGPPAAYNRGFELSSAGFVAMCPADDIWDRRKLEWQAELLESEPSIDILFGRARYFGLTDGIHPHPNRTGMLDSAFMRDLYRANLIATPTAVVRRELHRTLGRFDESLPSEDYEFWLRALRHGAKFFYDSREVVALRQHGQNVSMRALEIWEMNHRLRTAYEADIGDRALTRRLLARDLRVIARCRFGVGQVSAARAAYVESWRERPSVEAATGATVLSSHKMANVLELMNRARRRGRRYQLRRRST